MNGNGLKAIWAEGRAAINGWCSIGSPFAAEIMSAQGFDSLTVDWQHGALDYSDLLPMFQAMRASGATLMARVPWLDPAAIMKALDAGAMGIICPMVGDRRQAEEFVSYMSYPPLGQRSFGPTRAGIAIPGYGTRMNDEVLALAMVETKEGVANFEEIAATPGLDGIYIGPADLTLGVNDGRLPPGLDREEPEMVALIQRIAEGCKERNLRACLHCGTPEYAAKAVGWGYDLVTLSGDVRLLADAAASSISRFRGLRGETVGSRGRDGGIY